MADNTNLLLKGFFLSSILISLISNLINYVNASVFSYTPDMENLLAVQEQVIRSAKVHREHFDESDQRIIDGYISRWESELRKAKTNPTHYLENPINAYSLVRRLVMDLKPIERILTWDRLKEYKRKNKLQYPSELEQRAANVALIQLIIVYQFNITELANGTLKSIFNKENKKFVENVSPMIAADCFELAQAASKYYEHDIALAFAEQAYHKYSQDCTFDCPFKEFDVMLFLSNLYADLGELTNSLQWLVKNKTEELTPSEAVQYESIVRNLKEKLKTQDIIQNSANEMAKEKQKNLMNNKPLREKWKDISYTLCYAERINRNHLTCYYKAGPSPFLRLARLRAESLHLSPEITLFHNVISHRENLAVREMSVKQFTIAGFENFLNPDNIFLKRSNCQGAIHVQQLMRQTACFSEADAWPVPVLNRRAVDMSGMDPALLTQTLMIVANYGVGGYHNPHCDSEYDKEIPYPTVGTILYYLNEIDEGGATAFTELNLTIFPQKNSAIYWRNLLPGGDTNLRTKHVACPVVRGAKWIISKWMSDYVKTVKVKVT